jgi:2-iminobutanoate/2-iminopropanoate deaminase
MNTKSSALMGATALKKTVLKPIGVHEPYSSYSHGIVVEGAQKLIFCAGQVAGLSDGARLGPDDFEAQGELVMKNLKAVLAEAGATFENVVKLVTYVCNQHDIKKARALIAQHFPTDPPPNTICILRGLAHPDHLLEIDATAVA